MNWIGDALHHYLTKKWFELHGDAFIQNVVFVLNVFFIWPTIIVAKFLPCTWSIHETPIQSTINDWIVCYKMSSGWLLTSPSAELPMLCLIRACFDFDFAPTRIQSQHIRAQQFCRKITDENLRRLVTLKMKHRNFYAYSRRQPSSSIVSNRATLAKTGTQNTIVCAAKFFNEHI